MIKLPNRILSLAMILLIICALFPAPATWAAPPGAGTVATTDSTGGQATPAVAVPGETNPAAATPGGISPQALLTGSSPAAEAISGQNSAGGQSAQAVQPAPASRPLAGSMAFKGPLPAASLKPGSGSVDPASGTGPSTAATPDPSVTSLVFQPFQFSSAPVQDFVAGSTQLLGWKDETEPGPLKSVERTFLTSNDGLNWSFCCEEDTTAYRIDGVYAAGDQFFAFNNSQWTIAAIPASSQGLWNWVAFSLDQDDVNYIQNNAHYCDSYGDLKDINGNYLYNLSPITWSDPVLNNMASDGGSGLIGGGTITADLSFTLNSNDVGYVAIY